MFATIVEPRSGERVSSDNALLTWIFDYSCSRPLRTVLPQSIWKTTVFQEHKLYTELNCVSYKLSLEESTVDRGILPERL